MAGLHSHIPPGGERGHQRPASLPGLGIPVLSLRRHTRRQLLMMPLPVCLEPKKQIYSLQPGQDATYRTCLWPGPGLPAAVWKYLSIGSSASYEKFTFVTTADIKRGRHEVCAGQTLWPSTEDQTLPHSMRLPWERRLEVGQRLRCKSGRGRCIPYFYNFYGPVRYSFHSSPLIRRL